MKRTPAPTPVADLERFARRCIGAQDYPGDHHVFKLLGCPACGHVPMRLTIEHHTGSKKGDFKGRILGRCSQCGSEERIFSFTGKHRRQIREETPACECGSADFLVAECERIERGGGLSGFFDEGVVVGQCSKCGRNRALVYTD